MQITLIFNTFVTKPNTTAMNDREKLTCVHKCSNNIEAAMIRNILENRGIPCMLTNETFSSIYPIGYNSLGAIQVLVFERDADKAKQIIKEETTTQEQS